MRVIKSFGSANTERLFNRERVKQFEAFERQAQRKLTASPRSRDARRSSRDSRQPPGTAAREPQDQHSIRINNKWRVCFVRYSDAYDVADCGLPRLGRLQNAQTKASSSR